MSVSLSSSFVSESCLANTLHYPRACIPPNCIGGHRWQIFRTAFLVRCNRHALGACFRKILLFASIPSHVRLRSLFPYLPPPPFHFIEALCAAGCMLLRLAKDDSRCHPSWELCSCSSTLYFIYLTFSSAPVLTFIELNVRKFSFSPHAHHVYLFIDTNIISQNGTKSFS